VDEKGNATGALLLHFNFDQATGQFDLPSNGQSPSTNLRTAIMG
jgi:hypothetical protein